MKVETVEFETDYVFIISSCPVTKQCKLVGPNAVT